MICDTPYVVCVGDLHCGSSLGLCPDGALLGDGRRAGLSQVQEWIWDSWLAFWGWVHEKYPGAGVVLMGDIVEGRHHGTQELVDQDVLVHGNIAVEALRPFLGDAPWVYGIRGTECHARTIESQVYGRLGCVPDEARGDPCWEQLRMGVKMGSRTVHLSFKHHIGSGTRDWTQSSSYAAALTLERLEAARIGFPAPDVVVRGHIHRPGQWDDTDAMCLVTPPWQVMTRFARKVTTGAYTTIGGLVLDFTQPSIRELPQVHWWTNKPTPDVEAIPPC